MRAACQNPDGTPCGEPPARVWIGNATVSLQCPAGSVGAGVVVSRQFRSCYSQEHADAMARQLALCEAQREILCTWSADACATPQCGSVVLPNVCVTETSTVSLAEAMAKAQAAAAAAAAAACVS